MNFWEKIKKEKGTEPIIVLAPMADVTDVAFRQMFAKYGRPDVMWTEFVAADGLMRATPEGKAKLMKDLLYEENERPIVAQLFSGKPEYMEGAAALCLELGFDGIDINMGCPDKSIEKQKAGSMLIKHPLLAADIIRAAKRGAPGLPITVKTRLGYTKDDLEEWLPALLKEEPAVVTIHARTRKEMSKVPANWARLRRAVEIRDELGSKTLIFGNGDVTSLEDAHAKAKDSGVDGVMIGRAIFGNPWIFNEGIDRDKDISIEQRLNAAVEHAQLFDKYLSHKNFAIMKKHYKAYVEGFDGAKELRTKLMDEATDAKDVARIVSSWIKEHTQVNAG